MIYLVWIILVVFNWDRHFLLLFTSTLTSSYALHTSNYHYQNLLFPSPWTVLSPELFGICKLSQLWLWVLLFIQFFLLLYKIIIFPLFQTFERIIPYILSLLSSTFPTVLVSCVQLLPSHTNVIDDVHTMVYLYFADL